MKEVVPSAKRVPKDNPSSFVIVHGHCFDESFNFGNSRIMLPTHWGAFI